MHSSVLKNLVLALAAVQTVSAHTLFTTLHVDGVNQGDGVCVRMAQDSNSATNPLKGIDGAEMACGVNGEKGVARVCPVKGGATLSFEFRTWPDGTNPGALDVSHKGPCAVYMKKVDSAIADNNAKGDGWFKIYEDYYDGQWCTEKIMADGRLSVKLPSDLAGGYYLARTELLALHQADKSPPDPQFYVGCAQIFLESSGSATPETVSVPGHVSWADKGMTFRIWDTPMKLPYPSFGPSVFAGGYSRTAAQGSTVKQTEGLKSANCVCENANWCGLELDNYSGEGACWDASEKCYQQLTACYDKAPPTGSKNCKIWENKCQGIQDSCRAGAYQGPPNKGKDLTPAPSTKGEYSASPKVKRHLRAHKRMAVGGLSS